MAHATAVHPKMNAIAAIRLNMVVYAPTLSAATANLPCSVGIVKYFSLQSVDACLDLPCGVYQQFPTWDSSPRSPPSFSSFLFIHLRATHFATLLFSNSCIECGCTLLAHLFSAFLCGLCVFALSFSPLQLLLSSSRWAAFHPPLIPKSEEPHAVAALEPHSQHGLLQAHPLVAVSSGHAPHLLLSRIARRHVWGDHARHAPVHRQIQFRRPGLHPRRRRRSPPHRSRALLWPSQIFQLRGLQISLRQARWPPPAAHPGGQGRHRRQNTQRPHHHRKHRSGILLAHELGGNAARPGLVSHHRRHSV